MNTIEIYKDTKNEYRWRMLAENNEPVCCPGESFQRISGVRKNLIAVFRFDPMYLKPSDFDAIAYDQLIRLKWPAKPKSPAKKKKTK
jgi:hypothetical protein